MRILVAEDESRVAEAVARGLRREGMAVDVAAEGEEALYKARLFPYEGLSDVVCEVGVTDTARCRSRGARRA